MGSREHGGVWGEQQTLDLGAGRQPSMKLAYPARRGLRLCLEMFWQGAPKWWPKRGAMPVIGSTWQKPQGARVS